MVVLVVDDNETNSRVYQRVLSWLPGCTSVCIANPGEALKWSVQNTPALLIIDYSMPDMDGVAYVKAFRDIPGRAAVPVIMLTAMNSARIRDEAQSAGVDLFLMKPVHPRRFVNEVRRLLGSSLAHDNGGGEGVKC